MPDDDRSPGLKSGSPDPVASSYDGDFFTFTVRLLDAGADLVTVAKCDGSVQIHRYRAPVIPLLAVALTAMFGAVLAHTPVRPASENRGDLDGTVYWSRTIWPQSYESYCVECIERHPRGPVVTVMRTRFGELALVLCGTLTDAMAWHDAITAMWTSGV